MKKENKSKFDKKFLIVRNVFELYLPIAIFLIMFIVFILKVFFRYVLNHPLTWTQDVIVVSFCWVVVLGASYTMRKRGHVKFTLIYDRVEPKTAALLRLLGNIIIVITLGVLIIPSYNYCNFVAFQKTATLRLSYFWIFFPFLYFLISVIGYTIPEINEDILILKNKKDDSEDRKNSIIKEAIQ
jgi:TRAP-type C4-dicarboxylate transport system permease small subunit